MRSGQSVQFDYSIGEILLVTVIVQVTVTVEVMCPSVIREG